MCIILTRGIIKSVIIIIIVTFHKLESLILCYFIIANCSNTNNLIEIFFNKNRNSDAQHRTLIHQNKVTKKIEYTLSVLEHQNII